MDFHEYMAKLGASRSRIIGQIDPERIVLIPAQQPTEVPDDVFVIWDLSITHIAMYKGRYLSYISIDLPMPEYWVVECHPEDPCRYAVYSYAREIPEIDAVPIYFETREEALEFLR